MTSKGVEHMVRGVRWAEETRELAEDAAMAVRLARDLPRFLRRPVTREDARERVRRGLVQRERRFLTSLDRTVYRRRTSPYRALLRLAGCELGDVVGLVRAEGLEGTLRRLAAAGVYVSFDEFKGRAPTVRGSARFWFSDRDFDNPLMAPHYLELTGGSRGRPTRVPRSCGSVQDHATSLGLALDAHGSRHWHNVFWLGASLSPPLAQLKLGRPIDAWFSPMPAFPPVARAAVAYVGVLARLAGLRVAPVRSVEPTMAGLLVDQLTERVRSGHAVLVNSATSAAVRLATAAAELGHRLDGVTFQCRMEPLTPARRARIEEVGGRALADYASVELSSIGYGCVTGVESDDIHLNADRYAVVERERPACPGGPSIDALLFTSLSPNAPKIALNAESGDCARIQTRACGCALGELGLTTHLAEIRSFEKLSSEGTTFARSSLLDILEVTLPSRFGGTPLDYQIVEDEAANGLTRLVLRIAPGVGAIDEDAARAALLAAISRVGTVERHHAELVRRAGTLIVERRPPLATRAGKILPFQLARFSGDGGSVDTGDSVWT